MNTKIVMIPRKDLSKIRYINKFVSKDVSRDHLMFLHLVKDNETGIVTLEATDGFMMGSVTLDDDYGLPMLFKVVNISLRDNLIIYEEDNENRSFPDTHKIIQKVYEWEKEGVIEVVMSADLLKRLCFEQDTIHFFFVNREEAGGIRFSTTSEKGNGYSSAGIIMPMSKKR